MLEIRNKYSLITIGCSAGGIEALKQILPQLPKDFALPMVIVQHRGLDSPGILPDFFSRICPLPVREPEDKEPLRNGTVYLAPVNYHLMLERDGSFSLSVDDHVHHSRPSIDVFFETVADVYGAAAVGVILSGANADGAAGLKAIKDRGGLTIAQSPQTATHATMPEEAIRLAQPHFVYNLDEIKNCFTELSEL